MGTLRAERKYSFEPAPSYGETKLRQRVPSPELSDAEVLPMEVIGECLGIDTVKGLYEPPAPLRGEVPCLKKVHRNTSAVKQPTPGL
jgi:hypothetical protein